MEDGYWKRQRPLQSSQLSSPGLLKRHRNDYDGRPSSGLGHEMHNPPQQRNDHGGVKDTNSIMSAYDRYLLNTQSSSGESGSLDGAGFRRAGGGLSITDNVMGHPGPFGPDVAASNGRNIDLGGSVGMDPMLRRSREILPLPHDASNTLFVEGLPSDCRKREVAHIFRPFVGFKEVRLISKDPKHHSGGPLVFCFVDFANPACAATAMSALQGYRIDEDDPDSKFLRLQFSRNPGPRKR